MATDSFIISLNVEILLTLTKMNQHIQKLEQMPPPFSNSETLKRAKIFYQKNIAIYDNECLKAQEAVRDLLKNDPPISQRLRTIETDRKQKIKFLSTSMRRCANCSSSLPVVFPGEETILRICSCYKYFLYCNVTCENKHWPQHLAVCKKHKS